MKFTKTLKIALKHLLDVKMGEIVAKENTLIFDGDEYAVGTEVFVNADNEGEVIVAPDGEYTVVDENDNEVKVIVVRDGKIEEIRETETEDGTEETEVETEVEAEETVVEIIPIEDEKPEEERPEDRDRIEALENRITELTEGIAEVLNRLAALEGRIEILEGKMAKVEAPAADPAENEVEQPKMTRMSYLRKK